LLVVVAAAFIKKIHVQRSHDMRERERQTETEREKERKKERERGEEREREKIIDNQIDE
jgi:hypothetical protein